MNSKYLRMRRTAVVAAEGMFGFWGGNEPVRIFVGEAVEQHGLSTRLHKSLAEQDSKLIHR
ncbi:hypothetical protein [Burkholderia ambifaria]|uniref:hypothetical protein n=1 Tax=Burkholderia ambifaria TaxID=152480 RepID=UPI00158E9E67|nr:hypothetical protein [Burkholderia ambifaria]